MITALLSRWRRRELPRYRLFLILLIVLGVIFAGYKATYGSANVDALTEGYVGVYTDTNLPTPVTRLLSQSLVTLDRSGQPQPQLAESWTIKDNTYTFHLKDNLKWNDGTTLKSSDLVFSLPGIDVKFPDDKTIVFTLKEPFSPFITTLDKPVFKGDTLIGNGEYSVDSLSYDNDGIKVLKIVMSSTKHHPQQVIVRFYQDEQTAKTAFWLGEIDALLPISSISDFQQVSNIRTRKIPGYTNLVAIFYNTKDQTLSDKNFRKALGLAAPRVQGEDFAKTSIPPTSWAFYSQVREYLQNPQEAKAFLDKVKNGKDSTVYLTVTPELTQLGEQIVQAWKQIGVNAVARVESGIPQNFQALLIAQPLPEANDPDQYDLWHSTRTRTNISKYENKRADKDLEEGRQKSDLQIRKDQYQDLQRVLADDEPATFLYFPKMNVVYLKRAESQINQLIGLQFAH